MTPRPARCCERTLRRLRALVTDALGSAIAARWATGYLEGGDANAREELLAALSVAENALHAASDGLVRLEESEHQTGRAAGT